MKKTFCDICRAEMNGTSLVLSRVHKGMSTYLFVTKPDSELKHDICQGCIIDSVAESDDRPKCLPVPLDSRRLHDMLNAYEKTTTPGDEIIQGLRNEFP